MSLYSDKYIDALLDRTDYASLVEMQGIIWSSIQINKHAASYGLPLPIFVFVEVLGWFAQSIRSGSWTYFEATSPERQRSLLEALICIKPDYGKQYHYGMKQWRDISAIKELDAWIEREDEKCNSWLREILREHRLKLKPFYT